MTTKTIFMMLPILLVLLVATTTSTAYAHGGHHHGGTRRTAPRPEDARSGPGNKYAQGAGMRELVRFRRNQLGREPDATATGLERSDATERCGHADRATGIGAQRRRNLSGGEAGRRAAARSPGYATQVPGVGGLLQRRVLTR